MTLKAAFTFRARNPDVLTCIANLSNDEVFTPPEFANRILDTLAEAWACDNDGEDIWANKNVRFLDPCTKSGVFLREITSRLTKGLEQEIPDLQERVDHILTNQVFGIGITHLTSLLARRSLYCSKHANSEHSIANRFVNEEGNIWYERIDHIWGETKCQYCSAPRALLDRGKEYENYAYAFIHTDNIKTRLYELFGADMQFDVIIGNPPYQMKGGAGGSSDSSIYQLFVQQAIKLEPKYLSMVIPSRWLAGGRGLDDFRKEMLSSGKIMKLVDYPVSREVFPNVEVKGGICYFLWAANHSGQCDVTVCRSNEVINSTRHLDKFDIFIRDPRAIGILEKVLLKLHKGMDTVVSNREPFKLESNFDKYHSKMKEGDIKLYHIVTNKRTVNWLPRSKITKNIDLIDKWKVLVPKAGSDGGQKIPDIVLGRPWIAEPPSVCSGSFLTISSESEKEARSIQSYYITKFFRFLVSLRKITQDAFSHMYVWVPMQKWDREWNDKDLYKMYNLNLDEINYIETNIRPMELDRDSEND